MSLAGWHDLSTHLEWSDGPWFGFVFIRSRAHAASLIRRTRNQLHQQGLGDRVFRPRTPQALRELMPQLLGTPTAGVGCTWVVAIEGEGGDDPWTQAWDWLMMRANERRELLRRQLEGGLVWVAPPAFKARFREAAPDLWSAHGLLVDLPEAVGPQEAAGLQAALDEAQRLERKLPALHGAAAASVRRARGRALDAAVEALLAQGWVSEAEPLAEELVEVTRGDGRPAPLASALEHIAGIARRQGDLELAHRCASEALDLRTSLVEEPWQRRPQRRADMARCQAILGEIIHDTGDVPGAEAALGRALELRRELAAWSDDPETLTELALSLSRLGDLELERDALRRARSHFAAAREIRERVASEVPTPRYQRYLAVGWGRLGAVATRIGALDDARHALGEAQRLAAALAATDPGNVAWAMDASVSAGRLADLALRDGDLAGSAAAWELAVRTRRQLVEEDPGNARWLQHLAAALGRASELALAQGAIERAWLRAGEALDVATDLVTSMGATAARRQGWATALLRLADVERAQGDHEAARTHLAEAVQVEEDLNRLAPHLARALAEEIGRRRREGLEPHGDNR